MGKTDSQNKNVHLQQSVVIVESNTPGIKLIRPMTVFGYDDAPHGHFEISFDNVRIPVSNVVLGIGRGFEIVQGRLGPGRIHHCMRLIGVAERALEYQLLRVTDKSRTTFGKILYQHGDVATKIAEARIEIDAARLVVLNAAKQIDDNGAKSAMNSIAIAKVLVPRMALKVIDGAIQVHGGVGVSQDYPLAYMFAAARTLRIADGPDEVHLMQIARHELRKADQHRKKQERHSKI